MCVILERIPESKSVRAGGCIATARAGLALFRCAALRATVGLVAFVCCATGCMELALPLRTGTSLTPDEYTVPSFRREPKRFDPKIISCAFATMREGRAHTIRTCACLCQAFTKPNRI